MPPTFAQFLLMGTTILVLDTLHEFGLVWLVPRRKAGGQATLRRWQPLYGMVLAAMAACLALQPR